MSIAPAAAMALAALLGMLVAAALWIAQRGARRMAAAAEIGAERNRLAALVDVAPAMPVVIYADGQAATRAGRPRGLGLDALGDHLEVLFGESAGLLSDQADGIVERVREASAAGSRFSLDVAAPGTTESFRIDGGPAPADYPRGTVLIWVTGCAEWEKRLLLLSERVERSEVALDALSRLVEAAPFPIWHRGADLRLTLVNGAYVAAVEADDAMAAVELGTELFDEAVGGGSGRAIEGRMENGAVSRILPATVAGERRMMRVVEVPLGGAGSAGYAIDVEEQEQARADLARFVRAQRDMLDRLSAGVAQFGRDRGLTFFNQPFARLFSLRADFLADRPEFNRVLDAMRESGNLPEVRDFPEWKAERGQWFTSGLSAAEEDWLLPSGKHIRVVGQPLPDGGLLLIFEDRTEQILLASARDTLLRVRTATFDNLFEAVGVFASDGRLHLWNNRFRELWDFEEEQLAAHPRVDALTPLIARKLKNPNHAAIVRELVRSATMERKQRTGRVSLIDGREFEFSAVPLPDGNALFIMLDVTASRTVEAALRERNEALEEADRLKTAFVSNMSYELRTPLTSIAGFAEMLEAGYAGTLPPTAADYVRAILESVVRLGGLIDNVLDLTQSDTGSLLLAEEEVDLERLSLEAVEAARPGAEGRSIDFEAEVDPSVGTVFGDRTRLRQMLHNLLENAFAEAAEGGRVLLRAAGDPGEARIAIFDNGPGIAPADQARMFDRFYRNMARGRERDGTLGLALPLAKQFVEAHGGTVALQSDVGAGTTITVTLPRRAS